MDYVATTGTVLLPPGPTNVVITIPLMPDRLRETNEAFDLELFQPGPGAALGTQAVARVIIQDDELAGSLDTGFAVEPDDISTYGLFAAPIQLTPCPNGQLLAGARFGLNRLNPDGTRDPQFVTSPYDYFEAVTRLRPDGRILAGGSSSNDFSGAGSLCLRLLETNGAILPAFAFPINRGRTAAITLQEGGGIVIGGDYFFPVPDQRHRAILRVLPNGAIDPAFDAGPFAPAPTFFFGTPSTVEATVIQPDGKILAAGKFTSVAGLPRANIVRLNPNGPIVLPGAPHRSLSRLVLT